MDLRELFTLMPNVKHEAPLPDSPPAITVPSQPLYFVPPPVTVRGQTPKNPVAVIFSAPGAVGKSTLARYIASTRATALWDLSRLTLGDNSFVGTVANAFGDDALSRLLTGLLQGKALFVLDAFDEAELRSGWPRVETFLSEMWKRISSADTVAVVLLARTETAARISTLLNHLSGTGQRHIVAEIDYFDEPSARSFLDRYLEHIAQSDSHRRFDAPFGEAVTATFEAIGSSLGCPLGGQWLDPMGRQFLGYAPVLEAIAEFLAKYDNYVEAKEVVTSTLANSAADTIVALLLRALLDREQRKFRAPLEARLPSGSRHPDWSTIYSPKEQLARLIQFVQDDRAYLEPPDGVAAELVEPYVEALDAFIPQHPFFRDRRLAGPAFRDYVLAAALLDPETAVYAEIELESNLFVPTPLLAQFYTSLRTRPGLGHHAAYLYESATSQFGLDKALVASYLEPGEGPSEHVLTVVAESDRGDETLALEVPLLITQASPLTFRRRLRNAALDVSGKLVLEAGDGDFEIANSEISADQLQINAARLVALAVDKPQTVKIQADEFLPPGRHLTVHVHGGATLKVIWPGSNHHPWAPYHDPAAFAEQPDRRGVMLALRFILKWFRRDNRKDFAKKAEFIDNIIRGRQLTKNTLREALFQFLLKEQILSRQGHLYVLNADRASGAGLSWSDLRGSDPPKALAPFVDKFLKSFKSAS